MNIKVSSKKQIKTENIIIRATKREKKTLRAWAKKAKTTMSDIGHSRIFKGEEV